MRTPPPWSLSEHNFGSRRKAGSSRSPPRCRNPAYATSTTETEAASVSSISDPLRAGNGCPDHRPHLRGPEVLRVPPRNPRLGGDERHRRSPSRPALGRTRRLRAHEPTARTAAAAVGGVVCAAATDDASRSTTHGLPGCPGRTNTCRDVRPASGRLARSSVERDTVGVRSAL